MFCRKVCLQVTCCGQEMGDADRSEACIYSEESGHSLVASTTARLYSSENKSLSGRQTQGLLLSVVRRNTQTTWHRVPGKVCALYFASVCPLKLVIIDPAS